MGLSKRGGWRAGSGRKPNPAKAEKVERVPSNRGGARPGAGRKARPVRVITNAERLSYVLTTISPGALGAAFDQARAGDLAAVRELHALFTLAEKASQAALAAPACADLFAPAIDLPESEEKP